MCFVLMRSMVVLVGTMPSLASLVSLGSLGSTAGTSSSSSEFSQCSVFRRVSLSKQALKGAKRWHCVSTSVCKYSVTATDFVAEQGNAVSLDSNSSFRGSGDGGGGDAVLKPPARPVLKSPSNSNGELVSGVNFSGSSNSDDDEDEERNKVIESLSEVLEKAEKLETSKPSDRGGSDNSTNKKENGNVNKTTKSNTSSNPRNTNAMNSNATRKTKTMKSVWRKGDTIASVQKVVKEAPKTDNVVKEEASTLEGPKVESQPSVPLKPAQTPLRPQPKLQAKPSVVPPPMIKKPVVLKDVGAAKKPVAAKETDSAAAKAKERQPILIDKFARKKPVVDPLIAQAVLAPTKPSKGPAPGKFKDSKKSVSTGRPRRRIVDDDDAVELDEVSELNVSISGAATARKGRKWSKASRKAARLQAARDAAPVKVEILEVGDKGMLIEELAYNLAIGEGEILGFLFSKGIKPDGVQTLDKDMVKMICKEYEVEVIDADPVKFEQMARKKEFLDEEDLDKLQERPPVLTIMGHVDHGKVSWQYYTLHVCF